MNVTPSSSINASTSRAFDPTKQLAYWKTSDQCEQSTQTTDLDSMRRIKLLFESSITAVRNEVILAEQLARDKISQWDKTLAYGIWIWDASAEQILEAEKRSRTALNDAETQWRETFLSFAVLLFLQDDDNDDDHHQHENDRSDVLTR